MRDTLRDTYIEQSTASFLNSKIVTFSFAQETLQTTNWINLLAAFQVVLFGLVASGP